MTSLGPDCRADRLTVNTLGNQSNPVQTIYRASTDFYQTDLNWIETDSNELRMRLKEDGHIQIVEGLELFHGTEDIRTATKQFSVGLNSAGSFVIRDEVNGVDVLAVAPGQSLALPISSITGLQAALDAQQVQFMTSGGLSVSSVVLSSFGLTAGGDGASYSNSLVTAGALENFLEGFQEGFITVLTGQDSGHRVGAITATPSSTNVPSCIAVANHVTSKLNSFVGNVGTPFNSSTLNVAGISLTAASEDQTVVRPLTQATTTASSAEVYVQNVGGSGFATFDVGDTVFVAGISFAVGGVQPANLNGYHTLTDVTADGVKYNISTTASTTQTLQLADLVRDIVSVFVNGTTLVYISNGGEDFTPFVVGQTITVAGIDSAVGGIPANELNGSHIVTEVLVNGLRFNAAVSATSTTAVGFTGPTVSASSSVPPSVTNVGVFEAKLGLNVQPQGGGYSHVAASDFLINGESVQTLIQTRQAAGDYALNSLVNTKIDQSFSDARYQQLANVPAAQIYSGRTSPGLQAYVQQSSTTSGQFTVSFFVHTGPENFNLQAFELAVFWQQSRCQLAFISVGNEAHPWDGVTDALQQPSTSSAQPLPQRRLWQVGSGYTSYSTIAQTAQPDEYYDLPSYRVVFTQSTIDEGTSTWNQPSLPSYEFNKNNGSCFVCTLVYNIIGDWNGTQEVLFQANSRGFVNQGTQNYDSLVPHATVDDGFNYAFRDMGGDWDQSNRIPIIDVTSDGVDKFDGYYQRGIKLPSTDVKDDSINTTTATVTTLNSTALNKGAVNVLNETETDGRYATQTALSTYGGNSAVNFNASTVTLNNQVRFAALSYTEGLFSFLALSVRDTADSQYYPLFCSDVRYGANADTKLTTVISDIFGSLASKHPLTAVDETAGGTISSGSLITSGAVFAGNAGLQTQIDDKQPIGSYLTAVPANTNANLIADGTVSNTQYQYLSGVTSNIQSQLNSKAPTFSTDSTPTESSTNLVTSGGVYSYVNSVDHVTPIHDGFLSVSGSLACASTLWADGSLRVTGAATFNSAVIAGSSYFQAPEFRHTGTNVSLGLSTGSGALNAVAIGVEAARYSQSTGGVAIGLRAGLSVQATDSVAVGTDAARENQATNCVAIGRQACFTGQQANSIGIGNAAGNSLGERSIAIGIGAGVNAEEDCVCLGAYAGGVAQETRSVAIGASAGFDGQGSNAVAIGYLAGTSLQSTGGVCIGALAGRFSQGTKAVAIGYDAGRDQQDYDSVAVGHLSGFLQQGNRAVAIGFLGGATYQGDGAIAIGSQAQNISAGGGAIALGGLAGYDRQGGQSIAVGTQCGMNELGGFCVALGRFCLRDNSGSSTVAVGSECGRVSAGSNCILLGTKSGLTNAHDRTIVLNARTTELNTSVSDAFYIAPVRMTTGTNLMQYNTTTLEVTYSNTVSATLSCADVIASSLSASQITTPSLSVNNITIGSSIVLPTSVQYVALRHSYANTLTSGSTLNHSDASTFTTIVLGSGFGTWGSGVSYRAAFDDTGYDEHAGSGVFTPPSAYGSRLFRARCSITAACTGTATIYLEILKSGTVITSARLPAANCTTSVETLVFVDGATESVTFRLSNSSSGTWSLALTHTEPHLAAMSWELQ